MKTNRCKCGEPIYFDEAYGGYWAHLSSPRSNLPSGHVPGPISLPALVDVPPLAVFTEGDRVVRTYPLPLLARIGQPMQKLGTVTHTVNGWVSVSWDEGNRSLVNPGYLKKELGQ